MNRLDRITAILIQLQSRKVVKAQDIAERFDISLRTVYRDVKSLEQAGIPIIGEAGVGYSIMDGYRLPPVMFTHEEAAAFLTAEKLVDKLTDKRTASQYKDALYKIKAVLRSDEKGLLENIEDVIHVYKTPQADRPSYMFELLKSISDKKAVSIEYYANYSEETSIRVVEPVGIYFIGSYWHLVAWCTLRNDYRDFRLDRIQHLQNTDQKFTQKKLSLTQYINTYRNENELIKVVVSFDKRVAKYIQEQKLYFGFVSEEKKGDKVEVTFLTPSLHYFAKWLISFIKEATVIKPAALKEEVKRHISLLQEHYK
ncbi:MAG: YafY family protein [Flavipsychrobacter sp.]